LLVGINGDGAADALEAPRRAGDSGGRRERRSAREPGACAGHRGPGRREGRAGAEGEGRGNYHWVGLGYRGAELELKKTGQLVPERIAGRRTRRSLICSCRPQHMES
jgi:hypothetical protein